MSLFWGKMFTEGGMFGVNGRLMRSGDSRSIPDKTEKRFQDLPPLLLKPLTPGTLNLYWVSFTKNMLGRQIDEDLKFRLYHHSESDRIQLMERLQGPFGHLHPN